ncbi:MAG: putative ATPase [Caulobacteraceae bacterium]|nr:putative ATPase [Caulobacteraceae bacterium]
MPQSRGAQDVVSFGPFRLYGRQRLLKRDGEPVKLGSRAFDVLLALVDKAGEVVGQDELLARVWPGVFVGEAALRVNVAALRKALDSADGGSRYLTTITGRGYSFVAAVSRETNGGEIEDGDEPARPAYALPPAPGRRMVGRDDTVREICAMVTEKRFVTIVGAGGMGKTTVAVSVAHQLLGDFRSAVCFVELGPIGDPRLLAGAVASAFGLAVQAQDPTPELIAHLRGKRTLLILDGCEHLISEVANLSERLFTQSPELHILSTSREALRADGEYVYRLAPLACPPEKGSLTIAETLAFSAPQLFVARMVSGGHSAELSAEEVRLVGDMCRKLGGIALAIELAGGRVEAFGVRETARLLDSQFALLWPGRRTAPPRQQTLSATLDWSYNLLSEIERAVLRRTSVFVGGFTLEAAGKVAGPPEFKDETVFDAIGELVAKSLVAADTSIREARYRLLDTTRAYAALKLDEAGERQAIRKRHATYYRDLVEQAALSGVDPPGFFAEDIDNIRAALTWAYSSGDDPAFAIDLTALSARIWLRKVLMTECRGWMTKALALIGDGAAVTPQHLMIHKALASASVLGEGFSEDFRARWTRTLELARGLQDVPTIVTGYLGLCGEAIRAPRLVDAVNEAQNCIDAVRDVPDLAAKALADSMLGLALQHSGRHAEAQEYLQRALDADTEASRLVQLREVGWDWRTACVGVFSNLLWLRGFPDQAAGMGAAAIEDARRMGYMIPISVAMQWGYFNKYLLDVNVDEVETEVVDFVEHARAHGLMPDQGIALCLLGLCQARRGQYEEAEPLVAEGLRLMAEGHYEVLSPIFRAHLCEAALTAGHHEKAVAIMAELDARDRNPVHFHSPEILRVKGELALAGADQAAAKERFQESIALSREQGALSFELRTAMSLSKLLAGQGLGQEALNLVESVYARFGEGFGSADLVSARGLIAAFTTASRGVSAAQRISSPSIPPSRHSRISSKNFTGPGP